MSKNLAMSKNFDTKTRIIHATLELFFIHGAEYVTMKSVAQKAEIGKSTVYEYFDSKEDMISKSILYAAEVFLDEFGYPSKDAQSVPELGFEKLLFATIDKVFHAFDTQFGYFIRLMDERFFIENKHLRQSCQEELVRLHKKSLNYTKDLIQKGIQEGILIKDWLDMDVVIFQRMMVVMVASFYDKSPFMKDYVQEIPDRVLYVYHKIIALYGL